MTQAQLIKVGMSELHILVGKGVLKTTGLGSCVGVALLDPVAHVAGMAHVMLPSSSIAREHPVAIGKYADTAIPEMVAQMVAHGAAVPRIRAKLAGGAQMFAFQSSDTMRIGPRNVESCRQALEQFSIPIIAEDTGGNAGRTIEFSVESGILLLRTVQQGVKEI